jgi:hypothetical protein
MLRYTRLEVVRPPKKMDNKRLTHSFKALGAEAVRRSTRLFAGPDTSLSSAERKSEPRPMSNEQILLSPNVKDDGTYQRDERSVILYEGLRYSDERGGWVARFLPTYPEETSLPYIESTYVETLHRARILSHYKVMPSQSVSALIAFDRCFDRDAAKLDFLPTLIP